MTTNNHPAHGPVSLERLHQIREILSKAAAQSDGGNLGYAMADAVKVIDEVLERRKDDDKNLVKERQRVIDGLCTIGETAWEIEEYMKKWDAEHVAMKSFGNTEQLIKHQSSNQDSDSNASGDEIKQPSNNCIPGVQAFIDAMIQDEPVSDAYKLPPNSFTDDELEAMAHGDNPRSNAYRELLAFRRNSPATPDGSVPLLRRWLAFGRGMQKAGSQLPHNLIAETEVMLEAAPQQEVKP